MRAWGWQISWKERGDFGMALRVMEEGMIWPRPKGLPDLNFITMTAQLNQLTGNKERHDQLVTSAIERARMYGYTAPQTRLQGLMERGQ